MDAMVMPDGRQLRFNQEARNSIPADALEEIK
jgi:hypothetical protein